MLRAGIDGIERSDMGGWLGSLGVTETKLPLPRLDSFDPHLDYLRWAAEEIMPRIRIKVTGNPVPYVLYALDHRNVLLRRQSLQFGVDGRQLVWRDGWIEWSDLGQRHGAAHVYLRTGDDVR